MAAASPRGLWFPVRGLWFLIRLGRLRRPLRGLGLACGSTHGRGRAHANRPQPIDPSNHRLLILELLIPGLLIPGLLIPGLLIPGRLILGLLSSGLLIPGPLILGLLIPGLLIPGLLIYWTVYDVFI